MSLSPKDLQELLDELEASRASRKRAWENLQEIRRVLKDTTGIDLSPPPRKTIDSEGRIVKNGVRKALRERQDALVGLVKAISGVPEVRRPTAYPTRLGICPRSARAT